MSRFLLLILTLCSLLFAQDAGNALPRNDRALANAISGLGKRKIQLAPQSLRILPPTAKTCSVPLRAMRIDDAHAFASRSLPAPEVESMPRAVVPAPPCETASR